MSRTQPSGMSRAARRLADRVRAGARPASAPCSPCGGCSGRPVASDVNTSSLLSGDQTGSRSFAGIRGEPARHAAGHIDQPEVVPAFGVRRPRPRRDGRPATGRTDRSERPRRGRRAFGHCGRPTRGGCRCCWAAESQATRPVAEAENQPKVGNDANAATEEAIGSRLRRSWPAPEDRRAAAIRLPSRTKRRCPGTTWKRPCRGPEAPSSGGRGQGGDVEAARLFVRGAHHEQQPAPVGQELGPAVARLLPPSRRARSGAWPPRPRRASEYSRAFGPARGEDDRLLGAPRARVEFLGEA